MSKILLPTGSVFLTPASSDQDDVINGIQAMLNWMGAIDNFYWNPTTAITLGRAVAIQSKGPGWTAVCTQGGTTGSGEPTWGAGTGNAVTGDGTVNWLVYNTPAFNLPAGVVATAALADLSVATGKLADKAVTAAKMADHTITPTQIGQGYAVDFAGCMKLFAGPKENIQTGYLYCDGSAVLKASYPALWAAIGNYWGTVTSGMIPGGASTSDYFLLPDGRGVTMRGVSDGRQVSGVSLDPGRVLGTYQADALRSHLHALDGINAATTHFTPSGGTGIAPNTGGSINTELTGGTETRMMNEAAYWIICAGAY